jgi:SET domain
MFCPSCVSDTKKVHDVVCSSYVGVFATELANSELETVARLFLSTLEYADTKVLRDLLYQKERSTVFDFDFTEENERNLSLNRLKVLNSLVYTLEYFGEKHGLVSKFLDHLCGVSEKKDKKQIELEALLKINLTRLLIILYRNSFGMGSDNSFVRGFFMFGSLLNHACIPNASFAYYKTKQVIFVVRPIKKGEQVFIKYR